MKTAKLQSKLMILLFVFSAIPLLILFSVMMPQMEKKVETRIFNSFQNNLDQTSGLIESYLNERMTDMNLLAKNSIILSFEKTPLEKKQEFLKVQQEYAGFEEISISDLNGNIIASTANKNQTNENQKIKLENKEIIRAKEGKITLSDAQMSSGKLLLGITVPVINNGTIQNILIGKINMNPIWSLTDKIKINGSGYAYLINNDGRMLAHPDKNLIFEKINQPINGCIAGQREYIDENNEEIIEKYIPLAENLIYEGKGCWMFIIKDKKEKAFASLTMLRNQLIILFLVILATVFLTSKYVSKKISKPLLTLSEAANKLGKGEFETRVNIHGNDELEELGTRFNQAAEALESIDKEHKGLEEAKTRFLSITSHELRNPLTVIKGEAEILEKGYKGKLDPKKKESVETILRNAERLDSIVVDLLDISKIETARLKFNFVKMDIMPKIKEFLDEIQETAAAKNIKIISKVHNLPIIETDSNRIVQVLRNLINNAVKFSSKGSKIILNIEPAEHEIGQGNREHGNGIIFSVQDFGIGISPENQARIFEPFFQEEQTIYRKYGGTGLGLTVSKGIVESLGGKIWLKSKKGKGSVFYFTIPSTPPKEIKPFNFLLGRQNELQNEIKKILLDNLGPVGEIEFSAMKRNGAYKNTLLKRINTLLDKKIISKELHQKITENLQNLFDIYSENKTKEESK